MSAKTKIVEVDGARYQLRKLRPNVGSYILTRMLAAGVSSGSLGSTPKDSMLMAVFGAFLRGLDFDTFSFIQNNCLAVVGVMKQAGDGNEVPMPLASDSGVFAYPEVADNLPLVMNLTVQSLMFNLSDFFEEGGLRTVVAAATA